MKRVVLTGASGFIGACCMEVLLKQSFEVHAVSSSGRFHSYSRQVEWHHADLHNAEHVLRLMMAVQPHYLLHLAWDVRHGISLHSLENMRWVKSSLSLLQAFIDAGGKRVVMAGSCAEYDWNYGYLREDLTPIKPKNLYGICKNALYTIVTAAGDQSETSTAWGRLFFLYGPGEKTGRLVPAVVTALLRGEVADCTHGEQIRDYLYVKDAAEALVELLASDVRGAVNIASGQPLKIKEIIKLAAETTGRPDLVRLGALTLSEEEPPFMLANTRRLNEEVGWFPRYSLDEGLKETVEWWKKQIT